MITKDEYKALGFGLRDIELGDKELRDKLSKLSKDKFEVLKLLKYCEIEYYKANRPHGPHYPEEMFELVDKEVQHLEMLSFLREIDSSPKQISAVVSDLKVEILSLTKDIDEHAYVPITENELIQKREFLIAKLDKINKLKSLRELGRKNLDITSIKERAKQRAAGDKKNNKMTIKEKGRGESR